MANEGKTGLAYYWYQVEARLFEGMHWFATPIRASRRAWWQAKYGEDWIQKYMEHQSDKKLKKHLRKRLRKQMNDTR